jgi:hypothetical protein
LIRSHPCRKVREAHERLFDKKMNEGKLVKRMNLHAKKHLKKALWQLKASNMVEMVEKRVKT